MSGRTRDRHQDRTGALVVVSPGWLDVGGASLAAAWYRGPRAGTSAAVVIPGPFTEDRQCAVAVDPLAEQLAAQGVPTMVVYLEATGHSSGMLGEHIVDRWVASIAGIVESVRSRGFDHVHVVTTRLASLLVMHSEVVGAVDTMVLWAPVLNGRRFVREIKLLGSVGAGAAGGGAGATIVGTFDVPNTVLDRIAALRPATGRARAALVLDDPGRRDGGSIALLGEGGEVQSIDSVDVAGWLYVLSEQSRTPTSDIAAIVDWVTARAGPLGADTTDHADLPTTVIVDVRGVQLRESIERVGPGRIFAVRCDPVHGPAVAGGWIIPTHVQPGRRFIEFAREEACRGVPTLRFEQPGSSFTPRQPGWGYNELNSPNEPDAIAEMASFWHEVNGTAPTVLGFCSSARSALLAEFDSEVAGIAAIEPGLYAGSWLFRSDDGVTGRRSLRVLKRLDRRRLMYKAAVKYRIDYSPPSRVLRTLRRLGRRGMPVALLLDEQEASYRYWRRHRRRLGDLPSVEVQAYPGLGHVLTDLTQRDRVFADLHSWMERSGLGRALEQPADGPDQAGKIPDGDDTQQAGGDDPGHQ